GRQHTHALAGTCCTFGGKDKRLSVPATITATEKLRQSLCAHFLQDEGTLADAGEENDVEIFRPSFDEIGKVLLSDLDRSAIDQRAAGSETGSELVGQAHPIGRSIIDNQGALLSQLLNEVARKPRALPVVPVGQAELAGKAALRHLW